MFAYEILAAISLLAEHAYVFAMVYLIVVTDLLLVAMVTKQ